MIHPNDLPKLTVALSDAVLILFELPDDRRTQIRGLVARFLRKTLLISYTEHYDSSQNNIAKIEEWEATQSDHIVDIRKKTPPDERKEPDTAA